MALRFPALLPRLAAIGLLALLATATLTYAAGTQLTTAPAEAPPTTTPVAPLVVPDVAGQAFVFAKGSLEEAGFAWRVAGSVRGYAANVVVSQSPAPGTNVLAKGSPLVTLTLKRNGSYTQAGEAEDVSPYPASAPIPVDASGRELGPAAPAAGAPTATTPAPAAAAPAPAATTPPATTTAPAATAPAPAANAVQDGAAWPQERPAAFTVPGGKPEPLNEMPLPNRALALQKWLEAHPKKSRAVAAHWLYQNEWIVAGARLGWWHGAEALRTLVTVDRRAQQLWGIGAKSAAVAAQALDEVQAKAK